MAAQAAFFKSMCGLDHCYAVPAWLSGGGNQALAHTAVNHAPFSLHDVKVKGAAIAGYGGYGSYVQGREADGGVRADDLVHDARELEAGVAADQTGHVVVCKVAARAHAGTVTGTISRGTW